MTAHSDPVGAVRAAARPLSGASGDYDPLIDLIAEARLVLLGEPTHGTREFYAARAHITERLVREKNFTAVAVEADWPDAYRVNRYVRGLEDDPNADAALSGFLRFPAWMWRNTEIRTFIDRLREHNAATTAETPKVGFYGLDLYSLFRSMEAVVEYLEKVDPDAARRARFRYSCFEDFGEDSQAYGYAAGFDLSRSCEDEVVAQLDELRRRAGDDALRDGRIAADEYFVAEQNARLARDAEEYYRSMFRGRVSSWNLRDRHMADTLDALVAHLDRQEQPAKVVVWEHNSHVGDARATEMGTAGEWNVGQLVRERHDRDAVLIGFTTYSGTVTASGDWDGPAENKKVRPAVAGSYEALFHEVGLPRFLVVLRDGGPAAEALREPRLERAIGVVYRPQTERLSHYFEARLADQFDAVLHFDWSHALEPLDRNPEWQTAEAPETFPTGL